MSRFLISLQSPLHWEGFSFLRSSGSCSSDKHTLFPLLIISFISYCAAPLFFSVEQHHSELSEETVIIKAVKYLKSLVCYAVSYLLRLLYAVKGNEGGLVFSLVASDRLADDLLIACYIKDIVNYLEGKSELVAVLNSIAYLVAVSIGAYTAHST